MPSFSIDGNPDGIRSRASTMRTKGESFVAVGDALARISTDGWSGRAADHFRDSFDSEPSRWREAGNGFITAASGLETFASELEDAQRRAREAEAEYGRGESTTTSARQAYDADVNRARNEVDAATARGETMTLTILPFNDPGESIRNGALSAYSSAKADLETAGHACATAVRAGCAAAPEKRKWWESGLAAIGGFFAGAGEAVWDLVTLPGSPISLVMDSVDLATGNLTPEEMAVKYKLGIEQVGDILGALKDDPLEFGKNLGKAMLDWDTWADDPARALGHLLPDAVIAVLTAGTGAAATRGAKGGIDGLEGLSKMDDLAALGKLDDIGDLNKLDDVGDLGKLDDLSHVDLDNLPDWHDPDKSIDPRVAASDDILPEGFDPYGGLSRQEYYDKHYHDGAWDYPDNDGFKGDRFPNTLDAADNPIIDRFGRPSGSYASPEGTPYPERGLPPTSLTDEYHRYRVEKPLPPEVTQGEIAPAFEMPGGGTQYFFDKPIQWYLDNGYLSEVTP
jgi:hypothetical protein